MTTAEVFDMSIVEDLLKGQNEWNEQNEVIRLTFKAMSDVVQKQGTAISDIMSQLGGKVSNTEFKSGLTQKADELVQIFENYSNKENVKQTANIQID